MARPSRTPATPARIALALAMGFSATIACVAATAPKDASSAEVHPLTSPSQSAPDALANQDGKGNKYPGCPHGALEDPHRGFVRCLGPGEKSPFPADPDAGAPGDADASPPSDGGAPGPGNANPDAGPGNANPDAGPGNANPDAGPGNASPGPANTAPGNADAGAPAAPEPPKPGPPPLVEMKAPKFENGDAPKAEKNLSGKKVLEGIAKCVSENGGVTGKGGNGSLKVTFLVRAQGKAEGVEVEPTGASADAAKCVRTLLKNRAVGIPTADPVGVTVVYTLKPSGK